MATCKVKSFMMTFENWHFSPPSGSSNDTSIYLPVSFKLELDKGCTKSDCYIGQYKKGMAVSRGKTDTFTSWVDDASYSHPFWWDGKNWYGGEGSWSYIGEVATFADEPGFHGEKWDAYPLYYGGVARVGFFSFRTYVQDRASKAIVKELSWSLLIDYRSPPKGPFFANGCTEEGSLGRVQNATPSAGAGEQPPGASQP